MAHTYRTIIVPEEIDEVIQVDQSHYTINKTLQRHSAVIKDCQHYCNHRSSIVWECINNIISAATDTAAGGIWAFSVSQLLVKVSLHLQQFRYTIIVLYVWAMDQYYLLMISFS